MSQLRRVLALILLAILSAFLMLGTIGAVSASASVAQTSSEEWGKCC